MLRRSSLVECVSVLHRTGVYKASIFFIRHYVQPCLSKNPKYTFYSIKSSHIDDILEMVESSTYLFADDTKIFREIREENDEKMLQADLDSLQSWSDTWLLKFHPNKCKVMSVANKCVDKGTKHYYLYNNDGNRIGLEQSDGEKDIGVLVDENLSFNKHIQNQVNKANKGNNKITELRTILQRKVKTHNYINRQNQSTTGKL